MLCGHVARWLTLVLRVRMLKSKGCVEMEVASKSPEEAKIILMVSVLWMKFH
jgi:hypothetical protein